MPYSKRLIVPSLLILAGASVPVALGAATLDVDDPSTDLEFELGRLGKHRLLENSLVFQYRDELYVLRYEEWRVPEKMGMVSFEGTIIAAPLRAELLRKQKIQSLASSSDATRTAAPAASAPAAETPAATKR